MQNTFAQAKKNDISSRRKRANEDLRQRTNANAERQSGNDLEAIYESLHHELWALFYSFCGDAERAADAVHESFLRLQQQELSEIRNRRSWLLHVGRNYLRDVSRNRNSKVMEPLWDAPASMESSWMSCARSETRQIVQSGLEQLKELDRLALVLRYGMNWSSQRIAKTLESTSQAIDMRLSRARARLRDILTEQNPEFVDTVR